MSSFFEQIFIGSKFDAKGFKQAETALEKLANTTKKLAGAAGLAYGANAITAYGKAALKAFAQDEAAALRLNRAVTNLGIGFANPAISDYISNLERSAGIADDVLRPAFQSLLTTTGSLTKSQELLNNAITISRASGVDLGTVTEDLAKGYVGVTKGLSKYNTGLTRAELNSKSFAEILGVMLTRSAGAAEDYLGSTAYSMNVLSIATGNASEIIGKGLVDAFAAIAGGTEASDAAIAIEGVAKAIAGITKATGTALGGLTNVFRTLKNLPKDIFSGFVGAQTGVNVGRAGAGAPKLTVSQQKQQKLLAALEAAAVKRNKELLALKNKQLATDQKALAAKKLANAIDKANLAIGKGEEIFDMDKIQVAAALINQTEALGKATTASQVLSIANDVARLKVKQDIIALEDAIASKDQKSIETATAKLNADLKILGTLQNQNLKLVDIKSILDTLLPKDLINNANLDLALSKMKEMLALLNKAQTTTTAPILKSITSDSGIPIGDFVAPIAPVVALAASTDALLEFVDAATTRANAMADLLDLQNAADLAALQSTGITTGTAATTGTASVTNITVNTGIGDPEAIAREVEHVIRQARARGTVGGAVAI